MKRIDFYLDFISPYAYLAFEQLPRVLEGISHEVAYRPVLLGAILRTFGQRGPAEIPVKRSWTYRHVLWLAHAHAIPMEMPAAHPYNPLPHLRLALATTRETRVSRYVAETVFHDVWRGGGDPTDAQRLAALAARLPPVHDGDAGDAGSATPGAVTDDAKARLKANTDEAMQHGVFGVPAFEVDGRLFWGVDGLPMLRAYLSGDPWFSGQDWTTADQRPSALPPRA